MSADNFDRNSVLKLAFEELERAAFKKTSKENIAKRVSIEGDTGILEGVQYDEIRAEYPSSVIEVYRYYLEGYEQAAVQVTYTSSNKKFISGAIRI